MNRRPRHKAGTRAAGVGTGGRFTSKAVPTIDNTTVVDHPAAASVNDWTTRTINLWDTSTTFTRTVTTNPAGDDVVSVTTDCDPPDLVLLATKGDREYWSDHWVSGRRALWSRKDQHRRLWCAEITRRMLEEGLVATGLGTNTHGIREAMLAAGSNQRRRPTAPHVLTAVVAQLRGLRLIESMAPDYWHTRLDGYEIPMDTTSLLTQRFKDIYNLYEQLPQPPWDDPPTVPWGPQDVAGHTVTTRRGSGWSGESLNIGQPVFVGEHSDLIWRALTETTRAGLSPLKHAVATVHPPALHELIVAAALYDKTAETQITTDLFNTVKPFHRVEHQTRTLDIFNETLNNPASRWTTPQRTRIEEFIETVEALQP